MEQKIKILVVDDEEVFCRSLKIFLEKIGFQAFIATDGAQAFEILEEEQPVIMTLDMRMPGLNGYDVLQKVKRLRAELIIIVITAIDVPNMDEMLEQSGADALLHKPIDLQKLSDTIYGFVGHRL